MKSTQKTERIPYPRKIASRTTARCLGRSLLPVFFRIEKKGFEYAPRTGPLIIVGNHSAIMEVVLMVVYMPRQVEVLGSIDVPHEPALDRVTRWYGYIPYRRGQMEREPLRQALSVLEQGGVLGIFPEGGIWQISERRIQPGVAWLSEKAHAPVLPVFFSGTSGAIHKAFGLQRPEISMVIGEPIPPAVNEEGIVHKRFLHAYASRVMDAVDALRPASDTPPAAKIRDERFSLQVTLLDPGGHPVEIPEALRISQPEALAKFLHYPTILKIFKVNFHMPIDALQQLSTRPRAERIAGACRPILHYLDAENPYLLTYRFGQREGQAMRAGLEGLQALADWSCAQRLALHVTPVRCYIDLETGQDVVQTEQGTFTHWM